MTSLGSNGIPIALTPYCDDFETPGVIGDFDDPGTVANQNWVDFYSDKSAPNDKWKRNTLASGYGHGKASIGYSNYDHVQGTNGYSGIRMPLMDFSGASNLHWRFDVAYAEREVDNETVGNELRIYYNLKEPNAQYSGDWTQIEESIPLPTTEPAVTEPFIPTPKQWTTVVLALPEEVNGAKNIRLAFEVNRIPSGSQIYIDNVCVYNVN